MTIKITRIMLIVLIPILFGCEGATGPEGPAGQDGTSGPTLKGNITGFVVPVSADGEFVNDKSGVTASIEGTSFLATTKSDGSFTFTGVPPGIYTISYEKSGYGVSKSVAYQFIGGGTSLVGTAYICEPPVFTVSELSTGTSATSVKITLSEPFSTSKRIQFFVSPKTGVSKDPKNYIHTVGLITTFPTGSYSFIIPSTTFRDAGISPGNDAYFIAYAANDGSKVSGYTDITTGRFIYTNLSNTPSNVFKIVAP